VVTSTLNRRCDASRSSWRSSGWARRWGSRCSRSSSNTAAAYRPSSGSSWRVLCRRRRHQFFLGRLADRFGRRPILIYSHRLRHREHRVLLRCRTVVALARAVQARRPAHRSGVDVRRRGALYRERTRSRHIAHHRRQFSVSLSVRSRCRVSVNSSAGPSLRPG